MLGLGMSEVLLILVLALLIIGPKKLPELARVLGRTFAEFRKSTSEVTKTLKAELVETEAEATKPESLSAGPTKDSLLG